MRFLAQKKHRCTRHKTILLVPQMQMIVLTESVLTERTVRQESNISGSLFFSGQYAMRFTRGEAANILHTKRHNQDSNCRKSSNRFLSSLHLHSNFLMLQSFRPGTHPLVSRKGNTKKSQKIALFEEMNRLGKTNGVPKCLHVNQMFWVCYAGDTEDTNTENTSKYRKHIYLLLCFTSTVLPD